MATPSFSRSNVNERTLYISKPKTSSFDLSHSTRLNPQLGRLHPVNYEYVIPGDVVSGSLNPSLELEKIVTPEIGRTRLDTHTFLIPYRRIMNNFKQFVERRISSGLSEITLPKFEYGLHAQQILRWLIFHTNGQSPTVETTPHHSPEYRKVWEWINVRFVWSAFIQQLPDEVPLTAALMGLYGPTTGMITSRLGQYMALLQLSMYADACDFYWLMLHDWYEQSQFNYPSDFYAEQYARMSERVNVLLESFEPFDAGFIAYSQTLTFSSVLDTILYLLEPYMGVGSNCDYLGYPIYRKYGDWYYSFFWDNSDLDKPIPDVVFELNRDNTFTFSVGGTSISSYFYTSYYILNFLLSVSPVGVTDFNPSPVFNPANASFWFFNDAPTSGFYGSGFATTMLDFPEGVEVFRYYPNSVNEVYRDQSELPLRAAYAAWFDRFRDWHIESRQNVTDPDDWTLTELLPSDGIVNVDNFSIYVVLFVPRYRYFSRDALLTVQTEDVYRHVYAPIFTRDDAPDSVLGSVIASDNPSDNDMYNRILDTVIDEINVSFPSGNLHRLWGSDSAQYHTLRNDLQTMRRTGMLESWLARNYFYPDNYNGQVEAHYGVQVPDLSLLYCTYLGGDESPITGDQIKAPVTTSEAPAGTRTFVGGAGHSDKYSFTFNDFGIVISFVSIVPLIEYDAYNSHLLDNTYESMPFPEYASDARIAVCSADMLRGFGSNVNMLGYVPRYYHYRVRLDEVHGRYLTDLRSYTWFRDWYNMVFLPIVGASATNLRGFSLHPYCLRVHLPLDAFLGLAPWSTIAFGSTDIKYYVTHPLPAAIESF